MIAKEKTSLKQIVHLVFDWIRERQPGPASLNWSVGEMPNPLVLQFDFPSMTMTEEERAFLPAEDRVFSLDGSTPRSMLKLEKAREQLTEIGGTATLSRIPENGFALRLMIPAKESDADDARAKIDLLRTEIVNEVNKGRLGPQGE